MADEITPEITETPSTLVPSGHDLIDATQNAIMDAAENVSEAIGVAGNAVTELPESPFYTEVHFWVGVAFVLAILCIIKPIVKFSKAGLQRRINKVVEDIDNAAKLRDDAQELLANYERKFVNAQDEAQQMLAKARSNMQNIKKRETERLRIELKNKERETERRIAAATEKTKAEINTSASKASVDLAYRAINRYLQVTDKSKLIDEAIAELDKFVEKA
ncbi:MAG: ATP synthase F0 subunit B [Alphaproteobacteria bacterium]|nr:ATP synthase F0 subunit B [Alphaproteobacteria bacterium]